MFKERLRGGNLKIKLNHSTCILASASEMCLKCELVRFKFQAHKTYFRQQVVAVEPRCSLKCL